MQPVEKNGGSHGIDLNPAHVIQVDDDKAAILGVSGIAEYAKVSIEGTQDGEKFRELVLKAKETRRRFLCVVDLNMRPGFGKPVSQDGGVILYNGDSALDWVKKIDPQIPVIINTGEPEKALRVKTAFEKGKEKDAAGIIEVVQKPDTTNRMLKLLIAFRMDILASQLQREAEKTKISGRSKT